MKHISIFMTLISICGSTSYLGAETRSECIKRANMTYFKSVERANLSFEEAKLDCRESMTTVDQYLRCIDNAESKKEQVIRKAKLVRDRDIRICNY